MRIAVTGSSGLVGTAFGAFVTDAGHEVIPVVRRAGRHGILWDPEADFIEAGKLDGLDAVVHLAGENIAKGRWTEAKKKRIRDSRVIGTELLCRALSKLTRKPSVLVSSSAIGYYGERGDEICDESSSPGAGFLPEVCRQWEQATGPASEAGIRVVCMRTGVVLSPKDGALAKMLLPFRLGLGGRVGNGRQHWSWIGIDELVRAVLFCIENESASGPINGVNGAVTNQGFTRVLGSVLSRPTVIPMPTFAARLAFGEMGDNLLLGSTRVQPRKLQELGFDFPHRDLESALRHLLGVGC